MTENAAKLELDGMALPVRMRPAEEGDVPFIFSSWLQSFRDGNEDARAMNKDAYFAGQHIVIADIMQRPNSKCLVACALDHGPQIFGWACGDIAIAALHYVYVKQPYRRMGIAKTLVGALLGTTIGLVCTHRTLVLDELRAKHGLKYNRFEAQA